MGVSILNNEQPSLNTVFVIIYIYTWVCWNALMPLYIRIMIEGARTGLCAHGSKGGPYTRLTLQVFSLRKSASPFMTFGRMNIHSDRDHTFTTELKLAKYR